MSLTSGTRLGPYEILASVGAGGMGEVYRARDTRLDRTVAIKVLPSRLSSDPELRRRFEREARAISQLSHPHICALYDVGREGEIDYLVMEHLEGETLAARLAQGSLPLADTLRFGAQIAEALDRAHRAGIVHRDLKPGNAMLTRTGVKLLDFGLARKTAGVGRVADLTSAPTTPKETELTAEGTIAGTLQYMAPEQLEGKEPDPRTDIFALGVVLYEMATGRKAFSGTSQASLITAIMSSQPPPIQSVQPMAPPLLDRVVRRCLARDPDERWQSAADVAAALRWIGEGETGELAAGAPAKSRRRLFAWSAAVALLLLALIAIWKGKRPVAAVESPTRFLVEVRSSAHFTLSPGVTSLAVSPDGRRIAFVAGSGTSHHLWIRSLDAVEAAPLSGTEGAVSPFWSPDGRHVAFFAGGKLQKIAVAGGPPQPICESASGSAGTWGAGGAILFSESLGGRLGILRVSAEGGTPVAVTKPDASRGERMQGWPEFLPDGRRFLFLKGALNLGAGGEKGVVCLGSLGTGEVRPLFEADSRVQYAPPGYLLFVRDATLLAQPFDPERLALAGDAVPITPAIWYFRHTGSGAFAASARANVVVYQPRPSDARLVWLDREGRSLSSVGAPAIFQGQPRLSPDGRRIAVAVRDPRTGKRDLWTFDAATGLPTRLTFEHRDAVFPVWSPDGSRIAYGSFREGPPDLYVRDLSSGREELLVKRPGSQLPNDWSRDGARIVYRDSSPARQPFARIVILDLGGPRSSEEPPPGPPYSEYDPRFSPDGRWMALVAEQSGEPEVYVVPAGGGGERRRVSSAGGDRPRWRRDGRELYFLSADDRLMAVPVSFGAGLELGEPKALFSAGHSAIDFDAADGGRFLFLISSGSGRQPALVVNLNWASALPK